MELSNSERDAIRQNMSRRQVSGMSLVERWVKEAEMLDRHYRIKEIQDQRLNVLSCPLRCMYERAAKHMLDSKTVEALAEIDAISINECLPPYQVYCKIATAVFPELFKNWHPKSSIENCCELGWLHGKSFTSPTVHWGWSSNQIDEYMKEYVRAKSVK
jgi:hypothetical protein